MMERTGTLEGVSRDILSGKIRISFMLEDMPDDMAGISGKQLTITAKPYRKKRSLNANAYCWVLCTKIADKEKSDKDSIYELMLQRYGHVLEDQDNNAVIISLLSDIDVRVSGLHCKKIGEGHVQGKLFNHYVVIKGSSEYDTSEMATFVDGIVSEAKDLGIETLTPDELERIKAAWSLA